MVEFKFTVKKMPYNFWKIFDNRKYCRSKCVQAFAYSQTKMSMILTKSYTFSDNFGVSGLGLSVLGH